MRNAARALAVAEARAGDLPPDALTALSAPSVLCTAAADVRPPLLADLRPLHGKKLIARGWDSPNAPLLRGHP